MSVLRPMLAAILAICALTGCRAQPSVAAYLGSGAVTIAEVDRVAATLPADPANRTVATGYVLGSMIVRDIGLGLAAERGLTVRPQTTTEMVARYYGLPQDADVVTLVTETQNVLLTLAASVEAVEPTREQQRAAFNALYFAAGEPVAGRYPFEQIRPVLNRDVIGRVIALQALLDEAVVDSGVTVNPRYAGLTYALPVNVQLGQGNVARASILVHLTVDEVPAEEV